MYQEYHRMHQYTIEELTELKNIIVEESGEFPALLSLYKAIIIYL
jgi:hypothetical protein